MKRYVMITSFAESHLLRCLIPNLIETINPDKIIISEGKMPSGPENKGFGDNVEFDEKWTYMGDGVVGFDWRSTKLLAETYNGLVDVRSMKYVDGMTATECYIKSITSDEFEIGDVIYCLESDSFLHEDDVDRIKDNVDRLSIGEGLSVRYVDFLETQYYTEYVNAIYPKYRRFVYKFDSLENYQHRMGSGFVSQKYPELKQTDDFWIRHYSWWRPGEYKQMRFDLIKRNDGYWNAFSEGLDEIRNTSEMYLFHNRLQKPIPANFRTPFTPTDRITIRPSRSDEGRFAKFIDISHPKHIFEHPNFVK